ncbi:MAG TPA: hypothetical protein VJW77_00820 [Terriglobia bacterium]|nr:hypothetical protein [Terriglobia bacterium]
MSKKLESFNLQEAKDLVAMAKEGRCVFTVPALISTGEQLIAHVEELERELKQAKGSRPALIGQLQRQLQAARELANGINGLEVVCISSRSNAPCFDDEDYEYRDELGTVAEVKYEVLRAAKDMARDFLKMLEGK